MPPHSLFEWVVGRNIPRKKPNRLRRVATASFEHLTDDESGESETVFTYHVPAGTKFTPNKKVRFLEGAPKSSLKIPSDDTSATSESEASTGNETSECEPTTDEEPDPDCPCRRCIQARKKPKKTKQASDKQKQKQKSKAAPESSEDSDDSEAVHAKHKKAQEAEAAKSKQADKGKNKKKAPQSDSETTEATDTEATETEAETQEESEEEKKAPKKQNQKAKKGQANKNKKKAPQSDSEATEATETEATETEAETQEESEEAKKAPKKQNQKAKKGQANKNKKANESETEDASAAETDASETAPETDDEDKEKGKGKKANAKNNKKNTEETEIEGAGAKDTGADDVEDSKSKGKGKKGKPQENKQKNKKGGKNEKPEQKNEPDDGNTEAEKSKSNTISKTESKKKKKEKKRSSDMYRPNLLMPPRHDIFTLEHAVETNQDPRPNAYYDSQNGIMRVYHGPAYGNPYGHLYPQQTYHGKYLPPGAPHPTQNPWGHVFPQVFDTFAQPPPQMPGHAPGQAAPNQMKWHQGDGQLTLGPQGLVTTIAGDGKPSPSQNGKGSKGQHSEKKGTNGHVSVQDETSPAKGSEKSHHSGRSRMSDTRRSLVESLQAMTAVNTKLSTKDNGEKPFSPTRDQDKPDVDASGNGGDGANPAGGESSWDTWAGKDNNDTGDVAPEAAANAVTEDNSWPDPDPWAPEDQVASPGLPTVETIKGVTETGSPSSAKVPEGKIASPAHSHGSNNSKKSNQSNNSKKSNQSNNSKKSNQSNRSNQSKRSDNSNKPPSHRSGDNIGPSFEASGEDNNSENNKKDSSPSKASDEKPSTTGILAYFDSPMTPEKPSSPKKEKPRWKDHAAASSTSGFWENEGKDTEGIIETLPVVKENDWKDIDQNGDNVHVW
ncbi:hypothetical protein F4778DRAFT_782151 [Xylariomycetidae sp. FL2044]|nr:hypothetical protein F4778DRAFT_782151 [Xylariomycetidae sp. FL2044]